MRVLCLWLLLLAPLLMAPAPSHTHPVYDADPALCGAGCDTPDLDKFLYWDRMDKHNSEAQASHYGIYRGHLITIGASHVGCELNPTVAGQAFTKVDQIDDYYPGGRICYYAIDSGNPNDLPNWSFFPMATVKNKPVDGHVMLVVGQGIGVHATDARFLECNDEIARGFTGSIDACCTGTYQRGTQAGKFLMIPPAGTLDPFHGGTGNLVGCLAAGLTILGPVDDNMKVSNWIIGSVSGAGPFFPKSHGTRSRFGFTHDVQNPIYVSQGSNTDTLPPAPVIADPLDVGVKDDLPHLHLNGDSGLIDFCYEPSYTNEPWRMCALNTGSGGTTYMPAWNADIRSVLQANIPYASYWVQGNP